MHAGKANCKGNCAAECGLLAQSTGVVPPRTGNPEKKVPFSVFLLARCEISRWREEVRCKHPGLAADCTARFASWK
jgi:hypothetical protein